MGAQVLKVPAPAAVQPTNGVVDPVQSPAVQVPVPAPVQQAAGVPAPVH